MEEKTVEQATYKRFSHIAELVGFILMVFTLVMIQFPLHQKYNYPMLYLLIILSCVWTFFWYHIVTSKKHAFSLLESFIAAVIIALLISFTGGISSIFLLFLIFPVLRSTDTFSLVDSILILVFVQFLIFFFLAGSFTLMHLYSALFISGIIYIISFIYYYSKHIIKRGEESLIWEKVKAEEAASMSKYKDEFVYLTTHELRTPISVIRGYLDLLNHDDTLSEKSKEIIEKVNEHTDRLNTIVQELLDISKIETGKITVNNVKFNLCEFSQAVIEDFEVTAKEKEIHLAYINYAKKDIFLVADKDRLREVLVNLIDNAIKYTKNGGKVIVGTKLNGQHVELSVRDNGIGIPSDDQSKIFQKFFRAKNVYKLAAQGTGLGLYIVYKLIDLMKGYVQFSSVENKGSVFRIELPLQ